MGAVPATIRRHPLAAFLLLTFGICWGIPGIALALADLTGAFQVDLSEFAPLTYLAIWSPALSALFVIGATEGGGGLRAYARRIASLPGHWGWYAAVAVGVPLVTFTAAALTHLWGIPALVVPHVAWGGFAAVALAKASLGPVEELGWRGFALPHLQRRHSGLAAAVLLGFVWGLWHVPALFVQSVMTGAIQGEAWLAVLRLFVGITAKSVIMTALYNASGGSIALMFLYHWLGNLPYPWEADHGIFFLQDVFDVAIALVLVATVGRRWLGRESLHTEVTGR
jgi:membrane protease YdiL (CAAX protease family)